MASPPLELTELMQASPAVAAYMKALKKQSELDVREANQKVEEANQKTEEANKKTEEITRAMLVIANSSARILFDIGWYEEGIALVIQAHCASNKPFPLFLKQLVVRLGRHGLDGRDSRGNRAPSPSRPLGVRKPIHGCAAQGSGRPLRLRGHSARAFGDAGPERDALIFAFRAFLHWDQLL